MKKLIYINLDPAFEFLLFNLCTTNKCACPDRLPVS